MSWNPSPFWSYNNTNNANSSNHKKRSSDDAALHAFKRLRVNDNAATPPRPHERWQPPAHAQYLPPNPYLSNQQYAPQPQHQQLAGQQQHPYDSPSARHHQFPGQDSHDTPPPRRPQNEPPDTDYKSVNSVLGDLHRQRRLREHDDDDAHMAQAQSPMPSSSPWSTPPRRLSIDTPHRPIRHKKVVHLLTDSKLGL